MTAQSDSVGQVVAIVAGLTKGQGRFVQAVAHSKADSFHRSIIEPVEAMGLVTYSAGMRLIGRNAFPAYNFTLTDKGRAAIAKATGETGNG